MEITARVTGDAKVSTLKDERQVVNFNVAINDSYKPKGNDEVKKVATFIQCSYWMKPAIAQYLTKGTLVELYGRMGVSVYKDLQGEPKASLTFHVNNIKLHSGSKPTAKEQAKAEPVAAGELLEPLDDLPF
jgi:single-strand DNA-binding protein